MLCLLACVYHGNAPIVVVITQWESCKTAGKFTVKPILLVFSGFHFLCITDISCIMLTPFLSPSTLTNGAPCFVCCCCCSSCCRLAEQHPSHAPMAATGAAPTLLHPGHHLVEAASRRWQSLGGSLHAPVLPSHAIPCCPSDAHQPGIYAAASTCPWRSCYQWH